MKKIIFLLIPILLTIAIVEFFLHIKKPNYVQLDRTLGWKLKNNFNHTYNQKNLEGKNYLVNFSTNNLGMRNYITNPNKPSELKIFVFGDSFTSDPYASNNKMWYSEIANLIYKNHKKNTSVFSMGAGGYGNLQQLISIQKLKEKKFNFDDVNLVIFQFCNNDFKNNSRSIEKKLNAFNQYSRRPYLEDKKIIYDNSLISNFLRMPIIGDSRIVNKFFFLLTKIDFKVLVDRNIDYQESIATTTKIISEIKKELIYKNIVMINCSKTKNWEEKVINQIAVENNFIYFDFPNEIMINKKLLFKDGSHLSEEGNIFLGKYLYKKIKKQKKFSTLFVN